MIYPAVNGTEQRLDAVIAHLETLDERLAQMLVVLGRLLPEAPSPEPGTVQLKAPAARKKAAS